MAIRRHAYLRRLPRFKFLKLSMLRSELGSDNPTGLSYLTCVGKWMTLGRVCRTLEALDAGSVLYQSY